MSYKVEINCCKYVNKWGKDGAEGEPRCVDLWCNENTIDHIPTLTDIDRLLDRYGLEFSAFSLMADYEPTQNRCCKRFTMNRVEDDAGEEDDNGTWLADYDIFVYVDEVTPVECPDFGLPKV